MEAKEYQEIVNTADCNAEVNFVRFDEELRVMGWAKRLIDVSLKVGRKEVVGWLEEHTNKPIKSDFIIFASKEDTGEISIGNHIDTREWKNQLVEWGINP